MSSQVISSAEESEPLESSKLHQICFRVGRDVKSVWDSLPKSDKLVLTKFFRDAIASYSSVRTVLAVSIRDFAELASILKVGYESCKDALRKCEERCQDIESVRSECRRALEEYESTVNNLKAALAEKEAEIAKLKSQLATVSQLTRLRLAICSIKDDENVRSVLRKYNLEKVCD
jgi:predicted RNase H-like nuclease (RuvC/YqgF family)